MKIRTLIFFLCTIMIYVVGACTSIVKSGANHTVNSQKKVFIKIDIEDNLPKLYFPDSLTRYDYIIDSVDCNLSQFAKVIKPVNDFIKQEIRTAVKYLDTMSMKRLQHDTIFDIEYLPINSYRVSYSYYKNSSGIITVDYGCRFAVAEKLPALEIETIAENNSPLSRIIKLCPDEIFNALLLSWDIYALEQYLKYALPKYTSIYATHSIVEGDSVTDIQQLKIECAELYRLSDDEIDENHTDSIEDDAFIKEWRSMTTSIKGREKREPAQNENQR